MKLAKVITLILILTLAVVAVAADKTITINSPTTVNGTTLQPGQYKMTWNANGSAVDVKIAKGSQVLATATGQFVDQQRPAFYDSFVSNVNPDGSRTLSEIQFSGKRQVIKLNGESGDKLGK